MHLVQSGEIDVDDDAFALAPPVPLATPSFNAKNRLCCLGVARAAAYDAHDELCAGATGLCDHVLHLHVMLPKLNRSPVQTFIPRVAAEVSHLRVQCHVVAAYRSLFVAILLLASTIRPPWSATS